MSQGSSKGNNSPVQEEIIETNTNIQSSQSNILSAVFQWTFDRTQQNNNDTSSQVLQSRLSSALSALGQESLQQLQFLLNEVAENTLCRVITPDQAITHMVTVSALWQDNFSPSAIKLSCQSANLRFKELSKEVSAFLDGALMDTAFHARDNIHHFGTASTSALVCAGELAQCMVEVATIHCSNQVISLEDGNSALNRLGHAFTLPSMLLATVFLKRANQSWRALQREVAGQQFVESELVANSDILYRDLLQWSKAALVQILIQEELARSSNAKVIP